MFVLYQADEKFAGLGATHYHDSHYPVTRTSYYGHGRGGGLFSRHYFNKEGTEIGLFIPDLGEFSEGQVFDTPRVWGIPHTLISLRIA